MIDNMDMEMRSGVMGASILECIQIPGKKVLDNINGLMETCLKATGKTTKLVHTMVTTKDIMNGVMVKLIWANGLII